MHKSLLLICILSLLSSCKKGKEDPFISFRSRKARIINTWILKSHKIDGNENLSINTDAELRIQDNGNYFYSEINNQSGMVNIHSGKWDFLYKDDEYKNKERLILVQNDGKLSFIYEIIKLKNKELKLRIKPELSIDKVLEECIYEGEK